MAIDPKSKLTFIIALENAEKLASVHTAIANLFPNAIIFQSQDGSDAMSKIKNSPPHVFITEDELPKVRGTKIASWLFADSKLKETAVILLGPIPNEEIFPDEVVTGRLRFLDDFGDELRLSRSMTRALNYSTSKGDAEFRLKFLAPNDVLLREGETANYVYILRRGQLKAFVVRGKMEVPIGTVEPGEFVGEMAYINGELRSATVSALTEAELIEIPMNALDLVLFQKPSWARALLITLSKRLKKGNEYREGHE